jgi:UV DNA damage repair endonuclease
MAGNIESTRKLVERVGTLNENLRMVRLSSDILPVYTEPTWGRFWRNADVRSYCERGFRTVGDLARKNGVRLSMHPGQFCVMASESDDIVTRSIEEFEYHADMARWMGYGQEFQDFKINVHISGRRGPQGIRDAIKRLTPEARNCLTIENDEISWGIEASLELVDTCALVFDLHHHWVKTGEYINANDPRIQKIIDSWRGIRPTLHYSVSREDYLINHAPDTLPNHHALIASGSNKQNLRAHSDYYWNDAVNDWALTFYDKFDIMCESKAKNLASFKLHDRYKQKVSYA